MIRHIVCMCVSVYLSCDVGLKDFAIRKKNSHQVGKALEPLAGAQFLAWKVGSKFSFRSPKSWLWEDWFCSRALPGWVGQCSLCPRWSVSIQTGNRVWNGLWRPRLLMWEHIFSISPTVCVLHRTNPRMGTWKGRRGAESESSSRKAQNMRSKPKMQRRKPRAATPTTAAGSAPTGRVPCARLSDTGCASLRRLLIKTLLDGITCPVLQMRKLRIREGKWLV